MRGHIRQRTKGSYTIVISLGKDPETGKRKQQWVTVKGTKKDAERKLAELMHQVDTGTFIKPARLTVADYLKQWLQDYVAVNTSPRTHERYSEIVNLHLVPALGSIALMNLQPQHIQDCYAKALKSGRRNGKGGLSAFTVHKHHRVLFEALRHGVKRGLLIRNAAEAVDPPRPKFKEMSTLGPDEAHAFLEAARETPYYTLFHTALYTGLRRSELLGLRWCDVDLEMATLSVVQTLHRLRNGEYLVSQTKSRRSRRLVALPPSSAIMLREYREAQEATRSLIGVPLLTTGLVFSHPDGRPYRPDSVSRAFVTLAKAVGLNGVRFHDLRHTHATLMLRQGVHPKIVSERLGHSSVAITLDTYSHVVPGLQEKAARQFEEGLQRTFPETPVGSGALAKC